MTTPVSSSTGTPATAPADADAAKLKATAKQFEAVFLRQLIGSMRSASLGDGLFDSSESEQFRDMMDSKSAETMAGKGVLGVADLLVKQYGARLGGTAAAGDSQKAAK